MKRLHGVAALVLGLAVCAGLARLAFAARATPLIATFQTTASELTGVFGDGLPATAPNTYVHQTKYFPGLNAVQCFIGSNNKDADLVTYQTGRKLKFRFDRTSAAFLASGLPALTDGQSEFQAEVDLFAINYLASYTDMTIGWTGWVQMDLEFQVDRYTYELDYQHLAVFKFSSTEWLITSYPEDVAAAPDVHPDAKANLNIIRRRSQTKFGEVTMPIRFLIQVKP